MFRRGQKFRLTPDSKIVVQERSRTLKMWLLSPLMTICRGVWQSWALDWTWIGLHPDYAELCWIWIEPVSSEISDFTSCTHAQQRWSLSGLPVGFPTG